MTVTVTQFRHSLVDSGLMSSAEVDSFLRALPSQQQPADGQQLARQLVAAGRLTAYQAGAIYQGKGRALTLGSYRILGKLGQGGMGIVFRAQHQRLGRIVALKVLSTSGRRFPGSVRRFRREARAAGLLEHPNIVATYDAGAVGGVEFLVMQFVDGTSLSELVKQRGPLPVVMATSCVLQAAHGLEYAHARGVVHRDIKPGNLLLDRDGTVKILDMGLARLDARQSVTGDSDLTVAGTIMGTADYMAPEQAADMSRSDHRADIYSLGCTLWYLLTGREIFPGENQLDKLVGHWERPIPSLRAVCPEASPALEAVFTNMVAKRPENRYQTTTEVITELERCRTAEAAAASRHNLAIRDDRELDSFVQALPELPTDRGWRAGRGNSSGALAIRGRSAQSRRWTRTLVLAAAAIASSAILAALITIARELPLPGGSHPEPQALSTLGPGSDPPTVGRDWSPLFNGRDLTGWRPLGEGAWTVRDGTLVGTGTGGWLATETTSHHDFELAFQYRLAAGSDSGVFLLAWHEGQPREFLELQLLDDDAAQHRKNTADRKTAALVGVAAPSSPAKSPSGQWHDVIARLHARTVDVWFDRRQVIHTGLDEVGLQLPAVHTRQAGCIGLEIAHGQVEFRNVRIRSN